MWAGCGQGGEEPLPSFPSPLSLKPQNWASCSGCSCSERGHQVSLPPFSLQNYAAMKLVKPFS